MSKEMTKEAGPATPRTDAVGHTPVPRCLQAEHLTPEQDEALCKLLREWSDCSTTLERELLAAEDAARTAAAACAHVEGKYALQLGITQALGEELAEVTEAKEQAERRAAELEADARRYRWLKEQTFLRDPYDYGSTNYSSWNWTIELETGKSGGRSAPDDTPSFEQILDAALSASKGGGVGE